MSFLLSIWPYVIFCFIVGTFIGSFLLTVATRVPQGESMWTRSHCLYCKHDLSVLDLIPIFSFIFLKGKCRYCGHKISIQYLLAELLTGIAYACVGWKFGFSLIFLKYVFLVSFIIVIALTDIIYGVIPDIIVLIGGAFGLAFSIITRNIVANVIGSLLLGGLFLVIYLATKKQGMGDGDVTVAFAVGLYFDWYSALLVFMLSFLIGAVVGLIIFAKNKNFLAKVPFIPFLSMAIFIIVLFENEIVSFLFRI